MIEPLSNRVSDHYRSVVQQCIDTASAASAVAIFGASKAGWYIMTVLKANKIPIAIFCDNDSTKTETAFHGHPVMTPEEAKILFPKLIVFIGIFQDESLQLVRKQLMEMGLNVPDHTPYPFLYTYFIDIACRSCDHEIFANTIQHLSAYYAMGKYAYGPLSDSFFVAPFTTSVVTQKCTLRCKDCGQRIPYYINPQHFKTDAIVLEIKHYCNAFDLVPEISLHGGEPFTHPEIADICQKISEIPNLVFINVITNGTLLPTTETFRKLACAGVDIHQSDYGKLSKHQQRIFQSCSTHGVFCDVHYTNISHKWSSRPFSHPHYRNQNENDKIYKKCMGTTVCCQIMNGILYRCPLAAHDTVQGLCLIHHHDIVRLTDNIDQMPDKITQQIRQFLTRTKSLSVCDYCEEATLVEPAIQLSKKRKSASDSDLARKS